MAYESPISVWWSDTKIEQLRDEYGNLIVRAVKNVCPNVDKDELIKALEYDRGQYEKGFADGIAFEPPVKTHGDAFRAMTDEELAKTMNSTGECPPRECPYAYADLNESGGNITDKQCVECWLDWLREEATDGKV